MTTMTTATGPKESHTTKVPPQTLRKWLRDMLLIREFEVRTMQAYQNRKIGGFCHIYIGQEAVAVGAVAALNADDPVITAYRDHGHALARGMDPRHCMAEMFGRIGGCAKGKGGSMHMFDKAHLLYGGHGIVGAQCPLAVGIAFATKYETEVLKSSDASRVTMCFLGDGALNQGAFHEAMNLAGVLDLPLLFVCENNGYAMGTSVSRGTTMGHELTKKASAYGMESAVIDGMDVIEVYRHMKSLVALCRKTSRPIFVEVRTYRYKGHSMSDPRKYRTKAEEQQYEAQDPIDKLAERLIKNHGMAREEYDTLAKAIRQEVRQAIKWAEESPEPDVSELYTDVYVDTWGPYRGTSLPQMLEEGTEPRKHEGTK
ncbi:MAG: pyruvate dehydrogenase (acetyl-transferring) E1 component subunit alpha [Planctomycetota bacterium]|jgi:pyruvate dehydrogenase E1 component alpha subunit